MSMRSLSVCVLGLAGLTACSSGGGGATGDGDGGVGTLREVRFETRAEIEAGIGRVADAACADFDGDGHGDLAVTSLEGRLQVLLGAGDGTFQLAATVALPLHPSLLAADDLDADADIDLCVLASGADLIIVLVNDGNASFVERQRLPVGSWTDALALGDCDGDGRRDLVVARSGEPRLRVFPGAADGRFGADVFVSLPAGVSPGGLAIGDVTGDELGDLLVTDTLGDRLLLVPGLAGGGHAAPRSIAVGDFPFAVGIGDLNRDGVADVVVGNAGDATMSLLFADRTGFSQLSIPVDGPPGNVAIADVDGDRINDLVVCVFNRATISIFPGLRSGGLGAELQMGTSGFPFRALVVDVDGNGQPDLIASGDRDRLSLFLGRGGRLNGSINYATGLGTPEFVAAADLDGDGHAEVAVAGQGTERIAILAASSGAPGMPALRPRLEVAVGRPCFNVVKGDFDGDGRIDLAVSTDGGVKVLANRSTAAALAFEVFPAAPGATFAAGAGPFEIAAADLNRDGRADLVVTDYKDEKVTVLLARGGFAYEERVLRTGVGDRPGGLALADFSGDGSVDVAVSRHGAAMVSVLRNDGSGGLQPWLEAPVGPLPNYLRTADFDGDGRADLVVSVAGADTITVLLSRPHGLLPLSLPAGERPTALLASDLNRDGHADVLVASLAGADFRVLLGDGRGGFPTVLTFPGTFKATSADLADLDADGLPDLVVSSLHTTRVSVYRNVSR